ncbi:VOC family protein [Herbiconiux sp. A18JL235]|uniref:VOC family protein n=1 Tax=Herbiconiux sp. A18JL235 TaxID=3152363 RepID=A0AB39BK36_9MICO
MSNGIPGARGIDHIGITVPDLDEAEAFLVGVLGAVHVYTLGAKRADDDWMQVQIGVSPRTEISEIRFYRLGNGSNLEVFEYRVPADDERQQVLVPPMNSDIGGHHLAIYVDDMDAAVEHLRSHGVEVMGEPVASKQAAEGQRWVYFKAPWGLQLELVSFPQGKAYEHSSTDVPVKLWHPAHPAE